MGHGVRVLDPDCIKLLLHLEGYLCLRACSGDLDLMDSWE